MERYGYTICEASTAREAQEVWRSRGEEVALLLADIIMPEGITGWDLAEELRKDRPGLKVVFMSGYSAEVVGRDTAFFRRTWGRFVQKHCSPATLLQTVRQCLDEKWPQGEEGRARNDLDRADSKCLAEGVAGAMLRDT